jgi:hypothetical protein
MLIISTILDIIFLVFRLFINLRVVIFLFIILFIIIVMVYINFVLCNFNWQKIYH